MLTRLLVVIAAMTSTQAQAFCSYNGVDYARTTIAQEYGDSTWVVRARVVAADNHVSYLGEAWTLYRLERIEAFKGQVPRRFSLFTLRNSGGFYMDKGANPDLGGDYLLFLRPKPQGVQWPAEVGQAMLVNYACGRSGRWDKLTPSQVDQLRQLTARR